MSPLPIILSLFQAILFLLGKPAKDWADIKKTISEENFLDQLKTFNKDNIEKKKLDSLKERLANNDPDRVANVSFTGGNLARWLHALCRYAEEK